MVENGTNLKSTLCGLDMVLIPKGWNAQLNVQTQRAS